MTNQTLEKSFEIILCGCPQCDGYGCMSCRGFDCFNYTKNLRNNLTDHDFELAEPTTHLIHYCIICRVDIDRIIKLIARSSSVTSNILEAIRFMDPSGIAQMMRAFPQALQNMDESFIYAAIENRECADLKIKQEILDTLRQFRNLPRSLFAD